MTFIDIPKGNGLNFATEADVDHAHDLKGRRPVTCVFLFLNITLQSSW